MVIKRESLLRDTSSKLVSALKHQPLPRRFSRLLSKYEAS